MTGRYFTYKPMPSRKEMEARERLIGIVESVALYIGCLVFGYLWLKGVI